MEILSPITAWAWNDPVKWIEQVLEILKQNDVSYPGIRELRAKLTGKVDCNTINEFNDKANKLIEPAGLWFHPKLGLVYDGTDGTINRGSGNGGDESPSHDSTDSSLEEPENVDDNNLPSLVREVG